MWVKLDGITNPIRFQDTDGLVDILKDVLSGWTMACSKTSDEQAVIHVSKDPHGYVRRSPWIAKGTAVVHSDPVDAVCDLLLDLHHAYVQDRMERGHEALLSLHAAGVLMGTGPRAGLVVFPSTHASGKSLLATALATKGHRVFADDQLPVIAGPPVMGVSPGFLPRLRRPLPGTLNRNLTTFIRDHSGPMSDQFRYVDLNTDAMALLGEQAPVKAAVVLERRDGAKANLAPASENDVLKTCILQSFARKLGALEVLDHLHALVQSIECHTLTYDDAQNAVPVLQEAFA